MRGPIRSREFLGLWALFALVLVPGDTTSATPTRVPSGVPTLVPTKEPTTTPLLAPTAAPTLVPTPEPSGVPTLVPTPSPTLVPTPEPSKQPTLVPSPVPTTSPMPSALPSLVPTAVPSRFSARLRNVETFPLLYMVYHGDTDRMFSADHSFMNVTSTAEIYSPDSAAISDIAYVTVKVMDHQAGDQLRGPAWDSGLSAIQMEYDANSGVLTLSGTASFATYDRALHGVQFFTSAHTPESLNQGNQRGHYNSHMGPMIGRQGYWSRTIQFVVYGNDYVGSQPDTREIVIRRAGLAYTDATAGGLVKELY
jgi:hypothetical protein